MQHPPTHLLISYDPPPQAEIDAAVSCFGDQEQAEATRLVARLLAKQDAAEGATPSSSSRARYAANEQQDAILRAIDALPSSSGTALTRGDLQNTLNEAYRAQGAATVK